MKHTKRIVAGMTALALMAMAVFGLGAVTGYQVVDGAEASFATDMSNLSTDLSEMLTPTLYIVILVGVFGMIIGLFTGKKFLGR